MPLRPAFKIALLLSLFMITLSQAAHALTAYKDLSYVESDAPNKSLTLDIYSPVSGESDGNEGAMQSYPIHIFVHGGGWIQGDKSVISESIAKSYTDNGIMLISINYRLAPANEFPAFIEDVASAVAWVKNNIPAYGGDETRMVISGHSAGAHLVALLAANPQYLNAHDIKPEALKAFIPVDTASFDLTKRLQGKGEPVLLNFMRTRAFTDNVTIRQAASPYYQLSETPHTTPIDLFVTATRPFAVTANQEFLEKLKDKDYQGSLTIIDNELNHAAMKDEIFRVDSPIFKKISEYLKP